ncbi:hypothetical protein I7I50_03727 [Histoplasma capsulatum G186AR]|uniref:Uncharacterized protein n=1 Tax=Ajellomyces capsulatus TaxID=5037 RepID=A0A8H7YNL3_AJECA|nr:hypothetical protein I7I52_04634 [Histoplasma capsulatum]QSS74799.1 hypothetical protein I7I50_03727 [Histoplasma capsulatum G186AR]
MNTSCPTQTTQLPLAFAGREPIRPHRRGEIKLAASDALIWSLVSSHIKWTYTSMYQTIRSSFISLSVLLSESLVQLYTLRVAHLEWPWGRQCQFRPRLPTEYPTYHP